MTPLLHVSSIAFHLFCRNPKNTNIVENMVKALAHVVSSVQVEDFTLFLVIPLVAFWSLIVEFILIDFFRFFFIVFVKISTLENDPTLSCLSIWVFFFFFFPELGSFDILYLSQIRFKVFSFNESCSRIFDRP